MRTVNNTKIKPERKYVIVSNKHSGGWGGCMLFWGSLTEDNEKRSFGGYTQGIDRCERYTLDEIAGFSPHFTLWKPGMSWGEFRECEDVVIEPENLASFNLQTMQVWFRP